jgi:hypothetical protein
MESEAGNFDMSSSTDQPQPLVIKDAEYSFTASNVSVAAKQIGEFISANEVNGALLLESSISGISNLRSNLTRRELLPPDFCCTHRNIHQNS